MIIQKVGIIGAGTMGNGIAQACAVVGIPVVMVDISEAAVAKGIATVSGSLDRLLKKEKITEADKAAALSKIQGSTQYEDLMSADLVIEAATENQDLKVKILKQLDALLAPDVIIASNTSSISITQLAAVTTRADRFIGMHFFNPSAHDGLGGNHSRFANQRCNARCRACLGYKLGQNTHHCEECAWLCGQSHLGAHDQRSVVCFVRRLGLAR